MNRLVFRHAPDRGVRELTEARGIRFTLVSIIVPGDILRVRTDKARAYMVNHMRTTLRSLGIDFLDQVDTLTEAYGREGDALMAPLAHWSDRGNCLIAQGIAEHIAAEDAGVSLATPRASCADLPQRE